MKNINLILYLLFSLLISSCASLPQSPVADSMLIETGYGPEDMVIDNSRLNESTGNASLLISCSSRREKYPDYGEIERYFSGDSITHTLTRQNEPKDLVFRPHGISITGNGSEKFLYVINHDDERDQHPVLKYRIKNDKLALEEIFNHKLLVSPNALHAFSDGSFLVCNDAMKRNSMADKILRLKRSNIIFYDGKGNWSVVADKMGMVTGLNYKKGKVYASAALENKLYVFNFKEGELYNKQVLAKIKGPDNIRFHDESLLLTSHFKPFKFIRHVNNPAKESPSLVYSINLESGEKSILYSNPGNEISAASVALILSKKLYVGQIFEPWIREMDVPE